MRAQLIPVDGGNPVEILKDLSVVGRKEYCDLRIDHKSVSKMHCIIVKTDGLLLVRDLGSTNGTRVNGQRIRRAALLPNDQFAIAHFKFRVFLGPGEPPADEARHHTQRLDAEDIAELKSRPGPRTPADVPPPPIQPNVLPDLYPEERARGK